jgi:hypothetical protein
MNDQNQPPHLSLEEELDVLEAVYRVGKAKGLELLRPEQLKKLRDAGRMTKAVGDTKNCEKKGALDASRMIVGNMIMEVAGLCRRIYGDSWQDLDEANKISMAQKEFRRCYGADPIDFGISLFKTFSRTS